MYLRLAPAIAVTGAGLLACSSSAPKGEDVERLQRALHLACEPWMHGMVRKVLEEKLKSAGWTTTDDAGFVQSGAWGRVKVSVTQRDEPWSMKPAMGAVDGWLETAYPDAVKATASPAVVEGRSVDVRAWVAGDVKFARGVQRGKQTPPVFDMFFMVRRD